MVNHPLIDITRLGTNYDPIGKRNNPSDPVGELEDNAVQPGTNKS
jgi:hypothetical protein